MNKSRLLLTIVCMFLVHTQLVASTNVGTLLLTPPKKVSPLEASQRDAFLKEFNLLTFALGMYRLDTEVRLTGDEIRNILNENIEHLERVCSIVFDFDRIDFRKKGYTRYYPFTIDGKDYIIRIYLEEERHFLPYADILAQGIFHNSGIGYQIIPGINSILNEVKSGKLPLNNPALRPVSP